MRICTTQTRNCGAPVALYDLGAVKETLFFCYPHHSHQEIHVMTKTEPCISSHPESIPLVFQLMGSSQEVLAAQSTSIAQFSFHTAGGSKILRDYMCKKRASNSRATEWKTNKMSIFKLS